MNNALSRKFGVALGAMLLLLTFVSAPAFAEKADRQMPVNFSADRSEGINYATKTATLIGHVVVTQGTTVIHADKVNLKQNKDNTIDVIAWGNPVSYREKRDGLDEFVEGYAQRVEFHGEQNLLELFDRALLKRDSDEIRSEYISYDTKTGVFKAQALPGEQNAATPGANNSGRVTGTFKMETKDAKDGKKAAPAKPAGVQMRSSKHLRHHQKKAERK